MSHWSAVLALVFAICAAAAAGLVWAPPDTLASVAEALVVAAALGLFAAALWMRVSVVLAATVLAGLVALASDGGDPVQAFETRFAAPAGAFLAQFILVFVAGAIFGCAMDESGCALGIARAVSRRTTPATAPIAVAAICALLTLGGVGVFVIAFSVFPIAREIYGRVGLPLSLAPAAIALGAFTATMTALPGAPSLTNIVAAAALGTDAFAAPLEGAVAALVMAGFGAWWLARVGARTERRPVAEAAGVDRPSVPPLLAAAPLLTTLVANAALTAMWPRSDAFGAWGPAYWAVIAALALGVAAAALAGSARGVLRALDRGAASAVAPLVGTAVCIGFGASVASLPAMQDVVSRLAETLGAGSAAFAAAATALYAAVVGSSSGGLHLALQGFAETGAAPGRLPPELLHRFASLGASTLDTLPHSAAVIALLSVCGARHAEAYRDIFVVTVIGPALGLAAALAVSATSI